MSLEDVIALVVAYIPHAALISGIVGSGVMAWGVYRSLVGTLLPYYRDNGSPSGVLIAHMINRISLLNFSLWMVTATIPQVVIQAQIESLWFSLILGLWFIAIHFGVIGSHIIHWMSHPLGSKGL